MIIASCVFVFCRMAGFSAWPDSILENQIQVITLRQGGMTTGRRSSPVPQLQCVHEGTAGCMTRFLPTVVQCYNRGSNGFSTQWECKAAELDNSVKFGMIDVACEGFRDRNDPYVLSGSCGLRYTLDYTREARRFW